MPPYDNRHIRGNRITYTSYHNFHKRQDVLMCMGKKFKGLFTIDLVVFCMYNEYSDGGI